MSVVSFQTLSVTALMCALAGGAIGAPRAAQLQLNEPQKSTLKSVDSSAPKMGSVGVDARWAKYPAYLQRTMETMETRWEAVLKERRIQAASGSTVEIKFIMNSDGAIVRMVSTKGTADEAAAQACVSAITDPSPYGKWTDEMIAVLGNQQEMTLKFFYQ